MGKRKCTQANLYTFREHWLSVKVYRFACAHFMDLSIKQTGLHKTETFLSGDIKRIYCNRIG